MRAPRDADDPILDDLLAGACHAARAAAVPVMRLFQGAQALWDKDGLGGAAASRTAGAGAQGAVPRPDALDSVQNPLTEADLAADALLHEHLSAMLPDAGWLSEETADGPTRLWREATWIVDPIDGTREYACGIPEFAISIALALRGEVVLGVLLAPASGELIAARAGAGLLAHGRAASAPRQGTTIDGATLLASRTEARRGEFEPFARLMVVREVGSTAWKLGMLARGGADAYLTRKPRHEWDVAAGILLCREAGLVVTDLHGGRHRFNRPYPLCSGVVASVPGIHDELLAMTRAFGAT